MQMKIHITILMMFVSLACFSQGKFFGGNGDGFASATLSNVVLPLQVLNFSVAKQYGIVKASLKISSDELVCKMILEKSNDGNSYSETDRLEDAAGLQGTDFLFTDSSSSQATNYYRVKIIQCN